MTYIAVDPKSGMAKEYNNSAEFYKEVEEATVKPPEKRPEVKTYQDASERLREEIGLDLRSPAERQQAENNEFIEQRIAAGVSEALAKAQKAEAAKQAQKVEKVSLSPWSIKHSAQPRYKFFDGQECGCKAEGHKPKAEPAIHSKRGTGPTMTARALTAAEVESRLKQAGITL